MLYHCAICNTRDQPASYEFSNAFVCVLFGLYLPSFKYCSSDLLRFVIIRVPIRIRSRQDSYKGNTPHNVISILDSNSSQQLLLVVNLYDLGVDIRFIILLDYQPNVSILYLLCIYGKHGKKYVCSS